MASTVTFAGSTAALLRPFNPPTLRQRVLFRHLPRTSTTKVTELGQGPRRFQIRALISEEDRATALATLATWQSLVGTGGTLSWSINGPAGESDNCYLRDVIKLGPTTSMIPIALDFMKYGPEEVAE